MAVGDEVKGESQVFRWQNSIFGRFCLVDGWFGVVGKGDVLGGVHIGGDVDVAGMVTVVCWRSVFKICVMGDLFGGVVILVWTGVVFCYVSLRK